MTQRVNKVGVQWKSWTACQVGSTKHERCREGWSRTSARGFVSVHWESRGTGVRTVESGRRGLMGKVEGHAEGRGGTVGDGKE